MFDAMSGLVLILGSLAMTDACLPTLFGKVNNVYKFTVKDIDGNSVNFEDRYGGKALLIVNVATF